MTLKEKLEKLKKFKELNTESDWIRYRDIWIKSVHELENVIMDKWLVEYVENNLMTWTINTVSRADPYIGAYTTTVLEITLSENRFLVLEPISAVTSEYDGKLELYMRGNFSKKVNILRKINGEQQPEWLIAKSYDQKEYQMLDKLQLEKLIEEWL